MQTNVNTARRSRELGDSAGGGLRMNRQKLASLLNAVPTRVSERVNASNLPTMNQRSSGGGGGVHPSKNPCCNRPRLWACYSPPTPRARGAANLPFVPCPRCLFLHKFHTTAARVGLKEFVVIRPTVKCIAVHPLVIFVAAVHAATASFQFSLQENLFREKNKTKTKQTMVEFRLKWVKLMSCQCSTPQIAARSTQH